MPNLCVRIGGTVGRFIADKRHFRIVAAGAAIHGVPLPGAADVKQKFDLEAKPQAAQLVARETSAPGHWKRGAADT